MKKVTIRQSTLANPFSQNGYIICSMAGIIDYKTGLSKYMAETMAEQANQILEILPNLDAKEAVNLALLNESRSY